MLAPDCYAESARSADAFVDSIGLNISMMATLLMATFLP
jgi:hypothetical protein